MRSRRETLKCRAGKAIEALVLLSLFLMKRSNILLFAITVAFGLLATSVRAEDAAEFVKFDKAPAPMKTPPPTYPTSMSGVTGIVMVLVIIDETGSVTSASVSKASDPAFEAPSIEAIKKWKFKPAEKGGEAVKARVTIPLHFKAGT